MASLLPPGGFQLPFQRRLSSLYNDTKKSSDFVKEPVQGGEDPETKGLHRKLRIQKDRLVSWGLEWSDPNQSAEIDESLSRAGLSEVVGSIMSTIKDILAEAEPLWLSSKRVVEGARTSPDKKPPLIQWDKRRFEDLINDLTASIDTLYDLSRTRAAGPAHRLQSKAAYKTSSSEDFRPFESTRMQTPQQIDPATLTRLKPAHGNSDDATSPRTVVFMSKTAYSELAHGRTREPWGPLLLEYATFDSIYSTTGIMPPMARFEKLSAGLQQQSQRAPGTWTGLPRLLGYFEDMENSRLGLVYHFPPSFNAVSIERLSQSARYHLPTLSHLLTMPNSEPPLEAKFRLAYNLTNTVFDMHARGITHGRLVDTNIVFCDSKHGDGATQSVAADVRRPLVSSFDLFPDSSEIAAETWRHPMDPRSSSASPLGSATDERILELYALAVLLMSVGLWTDADKLSLDDPSTAFSEPALQRLSVKCGSLYMKAVQSCWEAVQNEIAGHTTGEALLSEVQMKVSRFLETCCILDGVSDLEQRMHHDLQEADARAQETSSSSSAVTKGNATKGSKATMSPSVSHLPSDAGTTSSTTLPAVTPESKLKLYPQVPLAPEAVEKWNTILMPQINQALRHFYRKHPESVEISLESVGTSPHQTEPTVLVVCASVGKVRAILKKRVGDLFDGSTGFSLKVCRGHVLRSHRHPGTVYRSMADADDDEVEAVNPQYQERPHNGASIGAWIGDRHLPPVSFGGLVLVDGKTYGMSVHHMLDDPDRDFGHEETRRSAAIPGLEAYSESSFDSMDDDYGYELSDDESEPYSDTDITSEYDDDDEEEEEFGDYEEPGDIPGIEPGCGEGYIVTQPALDDVEQGFYPCAETEDEDHLDTYSLGEVYASSGIRRREAHGLLHEVDWALFEFADGRLPNDSSPAQPTRIAPSSSLPGKKVSCVARTSGQQTGQILPALCSVKIYGRTSPSQTFQVSSAHRETARERKQRRDIAMGIPGDSGAWIVGQDEGDLCGHVLAWSQRKRVAYICPMDVLMLDIAQTLETSDIRLPGGMAVDIMEEGAENDREKKVATSLSESADSEEELVDEDEDEDDALPQVASTTQSQSPSQRSVPSANISRRGTGSPGSLAMSGELQRLTAGLQDLKFGQRINVSS